MRKDMKQIKRGLKRKGPKKVKRKFTVTIYVNSLLLGDLDRVEKIIPKDWRLKLQNKGLYARRIAMEYEVLVTD